MDKLGDGRWVSCWVFWGVCFAGGSVVGKWVYERERVEEFESGV